MTEALVPPGWAQRGDRAQSLHNTYGEQENFGASADVTYRPATCEEVQCGGWRDGWFTALPGEDARALYIRQDSGRKFREYRAEEWNERGAALAAERNAVKQPGEALEEFTPVPLGVVVFAFTPHQPCFNAANHLTTQAVNPLFTVRDHWGRKTRTHSGVDPFLDDFRTSLERTVQAITS
jgi:hypothetical protein